MKCLFRLALCAGLLAALLCTPALAAEAEDGATPAPQGDFAVLVNGETVSFPDAVPQMKDNRSCLPFLAVFDALRITRIRVVWPVGEGMEPDQAARAYGSAHAWLYSALGVLNRFIYLDFRELRLVPCIQPDTPAPAAQVSFRVSARALFVFIAAVQVLMAFHREKVLDVFL